MFVRQPTPMRDQPTEGSEQVNEALPGEPLTPLGEQNGWVRVETAYAYRGWLPAGALAAGSEREWPERTATDPLDHARSLLGAPYHWGGMTEHGIDCSGLVHMSFRATGKLVPRDADLQEGARSTSRGRATSSPTETRRAPTTSPSGSEAGASSMRPGVTASTRSWRSPSHRSCTPAGASSFGSN
jgi:cell wall-associated NlpC family hydrolase